MCDNPSTEHNATQNTPILLNKGKEIEEKWMFWIEWIEITFVLRFSVLNKTKTISYIDRIDIVPIVCERETELKN